MNVHSQIEFQAVVPKIDHYLARGLSRGLGEREGKMCVEAAICAALDLPHGDNPGCVVEEVRKYKILLNDSCFWTSEESRAMGLRDLAIAQLGSKEVVDGKEFNKRLTELTIRNLIPQLFRQIFPNDKGCLEGAMRCEKEGTAEAAAMAAHAATRSAEAADLTADLTGWAATRSAHAATRSAELSGWGAEAAARAAEWAAADAAEWAARPAELSGWATRSAEAAELAADLTGWAADASARAADASARAAGAAGLAAGAAGLAAEEYLVLSAKLALQVLRELKSPGSEWV